MQEIDLASYCSARRLGRRVGHPDLVGQPGADGIEFSAPQRGEEVTLRGQTMHRVFTERGQDRDIADNVIDNTASSPVIGRSLPDCTTN
jgi:hypothetical protein